MATIIYNFIPGTIVWHLTDDCGVKEATVKITDARVVTVAGSPSISTTLTYHIQYVGEIGTAEVEGETKLFADVASALSAYQTILEA
jgi:hypothetical protein